VTITSTLSRPNAVAISAVPNSRTPASIPAAPEDKYDNDYGGHSETWPGFEDIGEDGDTWRKV
jgi:hypothetical protein